MSTHQESEAGTFQLMVDTWQDRPGGTVKGKARCGRVLSEVPGRNPTVWLEPARRRRAARCTFDAHTCSFLDGLVGTSRLNHAIEDYDGLEGRQALW